MALIKQVTKQIESNPFITNDELVRLFPGISRKTIVKYKRDILERIRTEDQAYRLGEKVGYESAMYTYRDVDKPMKEVALVEFIIIIVLLCIILM